MKKNRLCIVLFILLCSMIVLPAQGDDLKKIKDIAEMGFKEFIQGPLSLKNFCVEHGITLSDLEGDITLGEPIQLYSISDKKILTYSQQRSVSEVINKTDIYMFPLLFNGTPKLFLDVSKYGTDNYEIGALGQSWLSREYHKVRNQYNKKRNLSIILCQNYHTHAYLFHLPDIDQTNLTLLDPEISRNLGYFRVSSVKESMTHLKEKLDIMLR